MADTNTTLDLTGLSVPLQAFPYLRTNEPEAINSALAANFHNGSIDILRKKSFEIVYNHCNLGAVSFNAAATNAACAFHGDSDPRSFALIIVSHGAVDIRTNGATLACRPRKAASLLDFEHRSVISVHPYYNNLTLRFTRPAIEEALAKLSGQAPRGPLRFENQLDLTRPGPRRLLAIVDQVIALFEQDPGLTQEPLLVAKYEQLVLTALLTCLDHNASALLRTPPPPAPPKVVLAAEAYIEANADKPLRLADLAALTGLSVRSIQLAFRKHRGYSPSRFLRECRLARAREMLRRAEPGTSLLAVSLACGFASQSLFCRLYRERFGEKPSETLAKG
ncbi:MAG: AraC family transcriptional regulator [Solidesulfovibrio sp. DCME]|uniref:AraC family transcriptional regulator n=1 Tax=Solidesulfovibrio sp. DCME TaxID=3447380 RepID=UPI003D095E42